MAVWKASSDSEYILFCWYAMASSFQERTYLVRNCFSKVLSWLLSLSLSSVFRRTFELSLIWLVASLIILETRTPFRVRCGLPMKPPGDVKFFPEMDVRNGFYLWCVAMARLFALGVELNTSILLFEALVPA